MMIKAIKKDKFSKNIGNIGNILKFYSGSQNSPFGAFWVKIPKIT